MENPNHPNDPNVPEGEQAPAAPDGFAPQRIGELDEPMVDPELNEEVMDDDDWDDDAEWLMAPVTPPRATMTVSSAYKVGGLSTRLGNLEYRHGVLMKKMEEVSDAEVADSITIGEIHPIVATMGEQVQVMKSQTRQVVSRLKEIEIIVQQVENRVDTHPSGQMAVQGQDVIVGSSQQIIMANLPPPNNDPNVPEDDQAPTAPDGFAPQWIGGHGVNNNNGWIEWDVPLGGEMDEPMVDLKFDEMDDDDDDDDAEWLMALVTPPRAT
nr:hypothetical protein [Tanacetum cinerariifolium]